MVKKALINQLKHSVFPNDQKQNYALAGSLFACGLVIGGVAAALIYDQVQAHKAKDGMEVLEAVKDHFKKDGDIEGSWIELQPVHVNRFGQEQKLYYGGISRLENNKVVQYEFYADAITGNIVDIFAID
ncbi:hypothetical protein QP173_05370 [Aerococcus urinae]|uniref:hypothetical protein n=1 Tax=Aerococcus TaxID=1375 RepID=UPI0018A7C6A3|nr:MULTISPECIES: hypothetical protein [Aerococcus]MCY3036393.1 hypothetical protein [Aerococcus sp. Group 2]MDK6520829.1 hypothetical protein [Aerococcus urinae]